ncbi:MAG TPA: hypothetical protein VLH75_01040 [Longimicrobiales bacterium]|nr:hypothetical protein [Longimicrobiales bacterium]
MPPRHVLRSLALVLPLALGASTSEVPQAAPEPIYVVYYWKARAGQESQYAAYVRDVAEKIDAEARKAGVFEEVHTYTPALRTGAEGADWTHMRVFKLSSWAALDSFSPGLDAATRRLYPNPADQPSSAGMRDLVRQEIWREFR